MSVKRERLFWIRLPYWLGIAADALWAVALIFPQVFGDLTGSPGFALDSQFLCIDADHRLFPLKTHGAPDIRRS